MRRSVKLISGFSASFALATLTYACSGTTFSSSSSKRAAEKTTEKDNAVTPALESTPPMAAGPNSCVNGDFVNINWSGGVKECFEAGKSWNFDAKVCLDMKKADFECNWDNVLRWFGETGLTPTTKVQTGKASGAKLVACGESADKHRLVVQFFTPPEGQQVDCATSSSPGNIVTGCYTFYTDPSLKPADPANDTEYKKQVYDCMNSL